MRHTSIQRRLMGSTLVIFLVAWLGILYLAVRASEGRFLERVDREIIAETESLAATLQALATATGTDIADLEAQTVEAFAKRGEDRIFQVRIDGRRLHHTRQELPLEAPPAAPFYTFRGEVDGQFQYWRFFRFEDEALGLSILAAYDLRGLAGYVDGLLFYFFWPLLAALPIALLALAVGIRYSLKPLAAASAEIAGRDTGDLSPLDLGPLSLEDRPREIAPLLEAIEDLFARLREAFEAEKRFTSDASHELRTPLAALKVNAQLLQRDHPELADHPALLGLLEGTDRAIRLVEQMLILARLEPESVTPSAVRLAPLVERSAERFASEIFERDLDFELVLKTRDGEDLIFEAIPEAIEVIVGNLLANAVRYGIEGGRVRLSAGQDSGALQLLFDNEGDPIPADQRDRLFDRFYRPASSPGLGAGLGLAIVRRAVQLHRGHVGFEEPDDFAGVRVRVVLPTPAR